MSNFSCPVVEIETIVPHPNADRLEIAKIAGYNVVVGKDDFVSGQKAIYVPESAVVPEDVLEPAGLLGKLSGSAKNRVRAIKLRGVLSQGILLPLYLYGLGGAPVGKDCSWALNITKYEPPIPIHMQGEVWSPNVGILSYDVESLQKYPDEFSDSDFVYVTEKIHGTLCEISFVQNLIGEPNAFGGCLITSKGLARKNLAFKNNEANKNNLYVRTALPITDAMQNLQVNTVIFGEIYGDGVQDLKYGLDKGQVEFRVFDILQYDQELFSYLPMNFFNIQNLCHSLGLKTVPVLASGNWSYIKSRLQDYMGPHSSIGPNIREGIVIRRDGDFFSHQTYALKLVSEAYLLRRGNTTEYN